MHFDVIFDAVDKFLTQQAWGCHFSNVISQDPFCVQEIVCFFGLVSSGAPPACGQHYVVLVRLMKLEVRLYGARHLKFTSPQGMWEASCILSLETVTHNIALPKTQSKLKNANPSWNRALQFEFDTLDVNLNVMVMETSDNGLQTIIGQTAIPLLDFASSIGQEVRHNYPLSNGAEVDIGVWIVSLQAPPAEEAIPAARVEYETVGPFQKKAEYTPTREVTKFKPEELKRLNPHLARGSFGIVYKGWAKGINQMVVIKDMEIQNKHSIDEWQKEVKIMAYVIQKPGVPQASRDRQTKSQYIAEVYGYSNKEKTLTIVMEYFENGDLFGVLHKYPEKHPLSLVQRMRMARQCALGMHRDSEFFTPNADHSLTALALQVLHSKNFMHRDIKSMNILVDLDYTCKLTDFGCSKLVGPDSSYLHTANTGTPLWMAPEVKRGEYGFASDIYSMGLVLYELFERKIPLYEPNTQVTSLPKNFQSAPVVLPCVAVNPSSRPNIEQVLVQLEKLLRRITEATKIHLSVEEKQKLQEAVAERRKLLGDAAGTPAELESTTFYQYLLKLPVQDADKLISMALAGPGGPPPSSHPAAPTPNASGAPSPPKDGDAEPQFSENQPMQNEEAKKVGPMGAPGIRGGRGRGPPIRPGAPPIANPNQGMRGGPRGGMGRGVNGVNGTRGGLGGQQKVVRSITAPDGAQLSKGLTANPPVGSPPGPMARGGRGIPPGQRGGPTRGGTRGPPRGGIPMRGGGRGIEGMPQPQGEQARKAAPTEEEASFQ